MEQTSKVNVFMRYRSGISNNATMTYIDYKYLRKRIIDKKGELTEIQLIKLKKSSLNTGPINIKELLS